MTPRSWHGRCKAVHPDIIVNVWEPTAGKARAAILRKVLDAGYVARLPDIQVRVGQHMGLPWIERKRRADNESAQRKEGE